MIALLSGSATPHAVFQRRIFTIPMLSGQRWVLSRGDLFVLSTLGPTPRLLTIEPVKASYTSATSSVDHGSSMPMFIVCLIGFVLVDNAATSVFFFIMVALLIDVLSGCTIAIHVARRDVSFGNNH